MQYFLFILRSAIDDFRRNKVRTFLTSLGILIGVSSVVLLMALGLGFKEYIRQQFENLGTNLIIVMPGKILEGGSFSSSSESSLTGARFDEKDISRLKRIDGLSYVVPVFLKTVKASGNESSEIGDLFATTSDIFTVRNLEAESGIVFEREDDEKKAKNVVIGPKIANKLFGSTDNAVGRTLKVENVAFKVIGVLKSKGGGGFGGPDFDSFIYMPFRSALPFNSDKKIFTIYLMARDENQIPQLKEDVKKLLEKNYDKDDFSVLEQNEILNAVSSIFAMLNSILVAIAAISLLVGGVGIMNIMFVSVMERTKEIGIRRAIGATRKDILFQFLMESIALSLIGGIMGLILSFITVTVIQRFFPAFIDYFSVMIALTVSSVIGILFGIIPSRHAAYLTPVEAIRYE